MRAQDVPDDWQMPEDEPKHKEDDDRHDRVRLRVGERTSISRIQAERRPSELKLNPSSVPGTHITLIWDDPRVGPLGQLTEGGSNQTVRIVAKEGRSVNGRRASGERVDVGRERGRGGRKVEQARRRSVGVRGRHRQASRVLERDRAVISERIERRELTFEGRVENGQTRINRKKEGVRAEFVLARPSSSNLARQEHQLRQRWSQLLGAWWPNQAGHGCDGLFPDTKWNPK